MAECIAENPILLKKLYENKPGTIHEFAAKYPDIEGFQAAITSDKDKEKVDSIRRWNQKRK